jgi:hypothetical protein
VPPGGSTQGAACPERAAGELEAAKPGVWGRGGLGRLERDWRALPNSRPLALIRSQQCRMAASPTFPTGAPILEFRRRKLNLFKGR